MIVRVRTALVAVALMVPTSASAQLAERVGQVDDGRVRFAYQARAGVEICDQGVRMGDHHWQWRMRGSDHRASNCRRGVVEVELLMREGRVREVDIVRALHDRDIGAVDLGDIDPQQASDYLLTLAYEAATDDAAKDAVFPALLADAHEAWRGLLELARDDSVHDGVRKNALFWLGQEAAESISESLADVAGDTDEAQDIRNAAIFALSQRDESESIPLLMDLARTGDQVETRKKAMFWLAQSDDPRVVRFFEEILLERIR